MRHIEPLEPRVQFNGGAIDPSFGVNGTAVADLDAAVGDHFTTVPFERDFSQDAIGRLYVVSEAERESDVASRTVIARLTRDGAVDTTFATGGYRLLPGPLGNTNPPRVFVDPHNRAYVLAGDLLWRLSPAGKVDHSFGRRGKIVVPVLIATSPLDVAFDADGRGYVAGSVDGADGSRMAVVRLTETGAVDTTWADEGVYRSPARTAPGSSDNVAFASALRFFPNGQLGVVGGFGFTKSGHNNSGVWSTRLNADGSIDQSYGVNGYAEKLWTDTDEIFGSALPLELARDGSVIGLITQASDVVPTPGDGFNFRISPDGKRVDNLQIYPTPDFVELDNAPVVTQPDGKILIEGDALSLVRSNGNGTLDPSWGDAGQTAPNTLSTHAAGFDLAPDGSIIVLAPGPDGSKAYLRRLFRDDRPLGQFDGHTITAPRSTAARFSVTWRDDDGIDPASLDSNDLRVYGPFDGQQSSRTAVLDGVESLGGGRYRATYHVTSAGGWTASDNGTYSVRVRRRQVKDTTGVAALASTLGTFRVQIG